MTLPIYDLVLADVMAWLPQYEAQGTAVPASDTITSVYLQRASLDFHNALFLGGFGSSPDIDSTDTPLAYATARQWISLRAALYFSATLAHNLKFKDAAGMLEMTEKALKSWASGSALGELVSSAYHRKGLVTYGENTQDDVEDTFLGFDREL